MSTDKSSVVSNTSVPISTSSTALTALIEIMDIKTIKTGYLNDGTPFNNIEFLKRIPFKQPGKNFFNEVLLLDF